MSPFEMLLKAYLVAISPQTNMVLTTRSGTVPIREKDLSHILPVIAWRTQIASRVMLGVDCLTIQLFIDKEAMEARSLCVIDVLDRESCLKALAAVLAPFEDGDLTPLEDFTTILVSRFSGYMPINKEVEETLLNYYTQVVSEWGLANSPNQNKESTMERSHGL